MIRLRISLIAESWRKIQLFPKWKLLPQMGKAIRLYKSVFNQLKREVRKYDEKKR